MMDGPTIPTLRTVEYHLACSHCGYDLYTLSYDAACPECGLLIMRTLCDIADRAKCTLTGATSNPLLTAMGTVAANTTRTLDEVMFFSFAHHFASEATRRPSDPPILPGRNPVDARRLCHAVRDFAIIEFGDSANDQLAQRGLATRENVAAFVDDMVRFGAMKRNSDDSADDFASSDCPDPRLLDTV